LENQPYLLDSLANYLVFIIQHIDTFSFTDPFDKKSKVLTVSVPSYIDAYSADLVT
jgi:hypothetical protein